MKSKDIAKKYGIDQKKFEDFLRNTNENYRGSFINGFMLDDDSDGAVERYKKYMGLDAKTLEQNA